MEPRNNNTNRNYNEIVLVMDKNSSSQSYTPTELTTKQWYIPLVPNQGEPLMVPAQVNLLAVITLSFLK